MESIKQTFSEWVMKRYPASTPKRVLKVLGFMIAAIMAILGWSWYELSTTMGSANALKLMVIVAGVIYLMYYVESQKIK